MGHIQALFDHLRTFLTCHRIFYSGLPPTGMMRSLSATTSTRFRSVVSVLNVPSSSINAMDSHKPDVPGSGIQEVKGAGRNKFIVKSAQWSHSQSAYVNSTSETPPGVIRFLLLEGIAHSIRRG